MHDIPYVERKRFEQLMQSISKGGRLMTLGHLLEWAAARYAHDVALICEGHSITYADLFKRACMLAQKLKDLDVQPEDRVLVWMENSIELYIAYFAALQIGAVVALLNVYLTERELNHIIDDAQAKVIITEQLFQDRINRGDDNPIIVLHKEDAIRLDEPIRPVPIKVFDKSPDALTVLLYTSGTTGLPKGVMLSSTNALTNAMQGIARQPFKKCKVLCVLPLFHTFAQNTCIWTSLLYGCTVIVVRKVERRNILQGLEHKPAIFFGVPALFGLLCLMKNAPIGSVELFISGGDALPDRIRSAFSQIYNRRLCNGYGLTETSPVISIDFDDMIEPAGCTGRPCIQIQIQVRDDAGAELPQGIVGHLWIKGPNVMLGYYNAPELTAQVLKDGWFDTGDLAYINRRGKIVISGREKDLIKNKGFNIYPQEVENVILSHPDVLRVAVIGKEDPAGEVPIAVVQVRADNPQIIEQLKKRCREQLAAYKNPKEFIIVKSDPPLTATGKINKKELKRTLYAEDKETA